MHAPVIRRRIVRQRRVPAQSPRERERRLHQEVASQAGKFDQEPMVCHSRRENRQGTLAIATMAKTKPMPDPESPDGRLGDQTGTA